MFIILFAARMISNPLAHLISACKIKLTHLRYQNYFHYKTYIRSFYSQVSANSTSEVESLYMSLN